MQCPVKTSWLDDTSKTYAFKSHHRVSFCHLHPWDLDLFFLSSLHVQVCPFLFAPVQGLPAGWATLSPAPVHPPTSPSVRVPQSCLSNTGFLIQPTSLRRNWSPFNWHTRSLACPLWHKCAQNIENNLTIQTAFRSSPQGAASRVPSECLSAQGKF